VNGKMEREIGGNVRKKGVGGTGKGGGQGRMDMKRVMMMMSSVN